MNDNILSTVDMRLMGAEEPMTPEGALLQNLPPLLDCGRGMDKVIFMRRVLAIAREYIKDYDLLRAVARSGEGWEWSRFLERDPVFIGAVRAIQEELTPEEIVSRAELLTMLKREATTAAKARDRIAAAKVLATIAGFAADEGGRGANGGAPTININLNGVAQPPMVNVTPAPPRIRQARPAGEEML